jgi:hypothetical protein
MGDCTTHRVVLWSLRMRDNQRGEEKHLGRFVFVQAENWGNPCSSLASQVLWGRLPGPISLGVTLSTRMSAVEFVSGG